MPNSTHPRPTDMLYLLPRLKLYSHLMTDETFHEPTPEQRDIVTRAVKAGLDNKTIAGLIDITATQLQNCYPRELQSSSGHVMDVVDALYERAVQGNVPAIKLYLECRAGWIPKEKEQEIASKAAPLVIKMWSEEDHTKLDALTDLPKPSVEPPAETTAP